VLLAETLHDGDGADGVLDLSEFAFEFFDVFLNVGEDGGCTDLACHPWVIDDVLCSDPFVLLDGQ
jgi:hypothetical protein